MSWRVVVLCRGRKTCEPQRSGNRDVVLRDGRKEEGVTDKEELEKKIKEEKTDWIYNRTES